MPPCRTRAMTRILAAWVKQLQNRHQGHWLLGENSKAD
jgi:hypothetical protein